MDCEKISQFIHFFITKRTQFVVIVYSSKREGKEEISKENKIPS